MINYLAAFTNQDGNSFPDTAAVNSSGPGTTDGTEFIKAFIDDLWGFNQALLNYTDDTPNGSSEADGASQRLDSLKKIVSNIDTISATQSYTVEAWNKKGVLICAVGVGAVTLLAGTGVNQTNKILVYNQSGSSITVNTNGINDFLLDGELIEYVYDGTSAWKRIVLEPQLVRLTTKTADYTILSTDVENYYLMNPNTVSQYGLLTLTMPLGSTSKPTEYTIEHAGNQGLVKVEGNGTEKINYKGKSLDYFYLFMPGNKITIYWNGSEWSITKCSSKLQSGLINNSDWTARNGMGFSNFDYDNQSVSNDLTGLSFTEATSNNTGIVLSDSAPSGNSGTIVVYNVGPVGNTGIFTNDRQITFANAVTADVNEPSGDNKNKDNDLAHNLGIDMQDAIINFFYNDSSSFNNASDIFKNQFEQNNPLGYGCSLYQKDTSNFTAYIQTEGLFLSAKSAGVFLTNQDWYYYINMEFNI